MVSTRKDFDTLYVGLALQKIGFFPGKRIRKILEWVDRRDISNQNLSVEKKFSSEISPKSKKIRKIFSKFAQTL